MSARSKARSREAQLRRRHHRVRRKVTGTAERPRLVVHRSLKNMQGHLADDVSGRAFAQFADAETLRKLNTHFVSRDLRDAHSHCAGAEYSDVHALE